MFQHALTALIASLLISGTAVLAQPVAPLDQNREDHHETERFLREAWVIERGQAVAGEEQAYLATMTDGQDTRTVIIQTLRPYQYSWYRSRGSFLYNVAAYQIDRLMSAGVVPCTVLRTINGGRASVTIWRSDETRVVRRADGARANLFAALVGDAGGTFAGGFYPTKKLVGLDGAIAADPQFRAALENLSRKQLDEALGEWLSGREIRYLIARRNRILARYPTQNRDTRSLVN